MKKFNELDLVQRTRVLGFIRSELKEVMKEQYIQNYFQNDENHRKIMSEVRKIAMETLYDDNGNILVEESLRA